MKIKALLTTFGLKDLLKDSTKLETTRENNKIKMIMKKANNTIMLSFSCNVLNKVTKESIVFKM